MFIFRKFLIFVFIAASVFSPQLGKAETDAGFIPVVKNDLYGYIAKDGTLVIKPQFDYAEPFSEGLAAVRTEDGTWGYIGETGAFAIEPVYGHASNFGQELGFVEKDGKFGFINRKGEMVIAPQFDGGGSFNSALANIKTSGKWGYIGTDGQFVIKPQFDGAEDFHEGLARICVAPEGGDCSRSDGKKFGFIDKSGKIVIPAKFDYAEHFSEGLAMARIEDMYGFIDKTGQWLNEPFYTDAGMAFSEGLARVNLKDGTSVFINTAGEIVLQPPGGFYVGDEFSDGLVMAMDQSAGKWGYMNKQGDMAIPAQFDRALPFKDGIAPAMADGKWGLINVKGGWVAEPAYDRIGALR